MCKICIIFVASHVPTFKKYEFKKARALSLKTTYYIVKQSTLRYNFGRVLCLFSGLFFHIHRHAGLEFHGEFVLEDGDFFNQPPDECLVVFNQSGGLSL